MTAPELALPADPIERYAVVLRLLAEQAAALADRVEADQYPYWPEANMALARQSHVAALVHLAAGRDGEGT